MAAPLSLSRQASSAPSLERFAGYRMKRAFNVIQSDLAGVLAPFGLRMLTFSALVSLVDEPGLTSAHLAALLDVERPNLVAVVEDLERRGLIRRVAVPTDRRARALCPTKAGRDLCREALGAVQAHEARLFAGLDKGALMAALDVIRTRQG